jgi:cytochrome c oxidase subunit 3
MITGFHGTHVTIGVIFLIITATKVLRGRPRPPAPGLPDRPQGQLRDRRDPGLYWHFVDLVWVFIFAFFYLW